MTDKLKDLPSCDQSVYEAGESIGLFDIPREVAESICLGISAATGARVDWHYFGGRVHIKALPAKPAVEAAEIEVAAQLDADEAFREWEKSGPRLPVALAYMSARDGFRAGAAWKAGILAGVNQPQDGVSFGFDDRSVMVSQEAYSIFLERETAIRESVNQQAGSGVPSVQITGHLDEIDAPAWEFFNAEARKLGPQTGSIDTYGFSRPNGAQPNGMVAALWNGNKLHALAVTVRDAHNRTVCARVLAAPLPPSPAAKAGK